MQPSYKAGRELFPPEEVSRVLFVEILQSLVRRFPRLRRQRLQVHHLVVSDHGLNDDGGIDNIAGNVDAIAASTGCGVTWLFLACCGWVRH